VFLVSITGVLAGVVFLGVSPFFFVASEF